MDPLTGQEREYQPFEHLALPPQTFVEAQRRQLERRPGGSVSHLVTSNECRRLPAARMVVLGYRSAGCTA